MVFCFFGDDRTSEGIDPGRIVPPGVTRSEILRRFLSKFEDENEDEDEEDEEEATDSTGFEQNEAIEDLIKGV